MADGLWLGIDLGTQSVRALAVDDQGQIAASAVQPLLSSRSGVKHTQEPADWWRAVCGCCQQVTSTMNARHIQALSIDATSGTMLLMDKSLHVLSEALMYDDARAAVESCEINAAGETFWAEMGYRTQSSWALPKLLWLKRSEPWLFQHAFLAHQNDYIHTRLAGTRLSADWSHALKSGFDLTRGYWPFELLDSLGLSPTLFPKVVAPGTVLGTVCTEAAEVTGLPRGCLIVAGMTDGCASQIAAGAIHPGEWNSVLGTTLVLKGANVERVFDPLGVVYSHRLPDGTWLPGGASSSGAGIITKMFPAADLEELNTAAELISVPESVTYPLAGIGERFPFASPDAHAFTLGNPHGAAEEFASVLLGVACIERLCFDYLEMLGASIAKHVSITGGGVRSRIWNQMRADTLRKELFIPWSTEAAFGSAVIAASSSSSLAEAIRAMVRVRETVLPRETNSHAFAERHKQLICSLETRGWLPSNIADFSRRRATA